MWNSQMLFRPLINHLKSFLQKAHFKIIMIFLQFIIKWQEVEFSLFVNFLVILFIYGEVLSIYLFKKSMQNIILTPNWQWGLCYLCLRNFISLAFVYTWNPLILEWNLIFFWLKWSIDVFHNSWIEVIHVLPLLFSDFICWVFWKEMINMLSSFLCILTFGYLKL